MGLLEEEIPKPSKHFQMSQYFLKLQIKLSWSFFFEKCYVKFVLEDPDFLNTYFKKYNFEA